MAEDTPTALDHALAAVSPPPPASGDYQRTLAENRAAAMLAHQFPRNVDQCQKDMRFSCGQVSVAEEAFFVLKGERNGKPKIHTGSTIKLARELARCWRNIDYGAIEVARTDTHSQILTYAVDLETNARGSVQNIVAHLGRKTATEIYEHNASDASRRLREIIFNILPGWFVAEAEDLCRKTLEASFSGPVAASDLVARLGALGISQARAETAAGRIMTAWRPIDLAALVIKTRTIERGDMRADDVFETSVADEIVRELTAIGKPAAAKNAAMRQQTEEQKPDAEKPKRKSRAKTTATPVQGPAGGTAQGGDIDRAEPVEGRPVEREDTPSNDPGNDGGTAVPPKATETPIKRGRGRPPKAKPEAAAAAPKPPKAPAKARLDLNGSPDAADEPDRYLLYWMERLRNVPADQEPLVAAMDREVRSKLKGMNSMLTRWGAAVEMRKNKLARAAEIAKAGN